MLTIDTGEEINSLYEIPQYYRNVSEEEDVGVVVPDTSMTSDTGGSLATTINLPGRGAARLLVRFLLYVRGLQEEAGNDFLSRGHDLRLELTAASNPPVRYTVSDLARLRPDNSWTMFQVEVIVRRSLSYELEILMRRGSEGVIAIDDISVEYKPVLAMADISIPLPENYTEPTETPDNVLPN